VEIYLSARHFRNVATPLKMVVHKMQVDCNAQAATATRGIPLSTLKLQL